MGEIERPAWPSAIGLCFLLLVATALQTTFARFFVVYGGGQPDFVLTLALAASLLASAETGCFIGFGAGVLSAAAVGETVGSLIVSRTIAGFAAGSLAGRFFRANVGVVLLAAILGTIAAEVVYALAAPPLALGFFRWITRVGLAVAWNALFSIPSFYLLRRVGWGGDRI